MKAKETREFLDKLNCEVCGYAKEMMEKGLCFHSCEDHFRLEETIDTELTELERLAEIGRATEIEQKTNKAIFEWFKCESKTGVKFLKLIYYSNDAGGYIEVGRFRMSKSEEVRRIWSFEDVFNEIK
ncbi:hypothetical protein J2Z35_001222 [Acetoanaerobium pronyense]|uniref:Uncharacterized protein n=1 Tax=Acetoanaerobium pronyense TaxID=1482736 RepID=A0ABS4KI58_9FIRM|nr:hypothetical protein [Acetoanaerobium pronyense]MBP2027428.1 hypothetical protein [Acetoanaerobium pronyense]